MPLNKANQSKPIKWYSPTCIISLVLLVLGPKFFLQLTDILPELSLYFSFCFCRASEARHLLYFRDTGSHVVRANIQQILCFLPLDWLVFGKVTYICHHQNNVVISLSLSLSLPPFVFIISRFRLVFYTTSSVKFLLVVQPLHVHVKGSIGEYH